MALDLRTRVENLRIGDTLGATDLSFKSMGIKGATWGWLRCRKQNLSSHTICAVNKGGHIMFCEMEANGIQINDSHEYDAMPGEEHLCWVGRHPAFDDPAVQQAYNDFMLLLYSKHLQYGWGEIVNFVLNKLNLQLPVSPSRPVCSQLQYIGYTYVGIKMPQVPFGNWAPMHFQIWYPTMINISPTIIGPSIIRAIC